MARIARRSAVLAMASAAAMTQAEAQVQAAKIPGAEELERLRQQVWAAERTFARSMAERDHAAFARHLSEQALFYGGPKLLRGKAAVAEGWRRFFEGPQAPFSWEPDQVDVLADGTLALSTGPVRDAAGKLLGRFNSVWRQEAPGEWRVVIDKGSPPDPGAK